MWEKFMKCFNSGKQGVNKGCDKVSLSDLYKRVPPNQHKQFKAFAKQNEEYKNRLRKYPADLPTIDWKFYRQNVRQEMVSWVDEFEHKYDNLDSMFTNRHNLIDHSKYFGEVMEQTKEVECDIHKYKEASNERIKILQAKMENLKSLKPYTEMTMEEFCLAHPNEAPDFINKPTFWPHTPEEQKPGPPDEVAHAEEASGEPKPKAKSKSESKDGKDPKKPPPKTPPTGDGDGAPAGDKPQTPPAPPPTAKDAKPKEAKAPKNEKQATPTKETKPPPADAKANMIANTENQAVETASEMATKGVAFVQDLTTKAVTMLKTMWEKVGEKRKQVAESAEAARLKNEADEKNKNAGMLAAKTVQTQPDDDEDSYFRRESRSDICNKTIIRGEDTAKADVKPHHVDLDIEQTVEPDECTKEKDDKDCKTTKKCEEEKKDVCSPKPECKEEKKDVSPPKAECKEEKKDVSPPKLECKEEKKDFSPPQPQCSQPDKENICILPSRVASSKPKTDAPTCESIQIIGEKTDNIKPENRQLGTTIFSSVTQEAVTSLRKDVPDSEDSESKSNKLKNDVLNKYVSDMANNAALLLSEARSIIKQAHYQNPDNIEGLKSAFQAAEQKVIQALGQASKALSTARSLANQKTSESKELKKQIEIEHAMLVKLLMRRAIAMKNEIGRLLSGLEKRKND